ncbi:MAG: hypothetical protein ACE37E_05285 [Hyphomicrobiales bacterium]
MAVPDSKIILVIDIIAAGEFIARTGRRTIGCGKESATLYLEQADATGETSPFLPMNLPSHELGIALAVMTPAERKNDVYPTHHDNI